LGRKILKGFGVMCAVALLSGCLSTTASMSNDKCGASKFQSFLGKPVSALANKILRTGVQNGVSIYGASQVPARTRPSDKLGTITSKNKFDITSKQTVIVVYDDRNGVLPYQGKDPKAKFIGAVENNITTISCGLR